LIFFFELCSFSIFVWLSYTVESLFLEFNIRTIKVNKHERAQEPGLSNNETQFRITSDGWDIKNRNERRKRGISERYENLI
jgi:hypothetical protein